MVIWRYLNILNLKNKKMRTSRSFLEWDNFYVEWNNYFYAAHDGIFQSQSPNGISFNYQSVNIRALAKVLILTTGIFPAWSLNKFFNFLQPKCYSWIALKRIRPISNVFTLLEYILRIKIKNKWENEEDLEFFLNRSNFTWNRTIIPIRLIKVIF